MKLIALVSLLLSFSCIADEPNWVLNSQELGYKYAIVGSAMPQKMGHQAQYKMAEFAAKKEFAANKSTYISSIQKDYNDSNEHSNFESATSINSGALISFSLFSQQKEWKDPETGELFLLYVVSE